MAITSNPPSTAPITHRLPWPGRAEYALSGHGLLTLSVHNGDLLRCETGVLWITRDGHLRDLVLKPGAGHRVQGPARLRVSAFGAARLSVIAGAPA